MVCEAALPLRVGDRALLRDPGSRRIWGVRVLDPDPPALRRRGAAAARAKDLVAADGWLMSGAHARLAPDADAHLDRRGWTRRHPDDRREIRD